MAFGSIIATLLPSLEERVPGVPFVTEVPASRPAEFVRIWRNGGQAQNRVVDLPFVSVETWAATASRADDISDAVRHVLLHDAPGLGRIRGATEIAGPYEIPDPDSGTPRVRFTVQLTVRATRP